jgi:hypothetical protein
MAASSLKFSYAPFMSRLALVLMALLPVSIASAVPEPNPVPTRWEFEFRPEPLRLVELTDEDGVTAWYAFLTYRVTNTSGQDRMLAPLFELATDKGDLVRSGRGVAPEITQQIMDMLSDPLLQDQLSIVSTLLQGVENTRRGLAIWRVPDITADELKVFAAGFSGESEAFFVTDPETGERVRKVLRKSRMLRYAMPGVISELSSPTPDLAEARWILR